MHTRAIRGTKWLTALPKRFGRDGKPLKKFHFKSGPLLQHRLAKWAWIEAAPSHELPGLRRILQNESPDEDKGKLDVTLQGVARQPLQSFRSAKIRIATANVGTMSYGSEQGQGVSSKAMELLRQFEENGVHIIGVQESRATRTQCVENGPYTRMIVAGEKEMLEWSFGSMEGP